MKIVKQLRQGGYKVHIIHRRLYITNEFYSKSWFLSAFERDELLNKEKDLKLIGPIEYSGETIVEIITPKGLSVSATAECSISDNFCRREGLRIALNRALNVLKG